MLALILGDSLSFQLQKDPKFLFQLQICDFS